MIKLLIPIFAVLIIFLSFGAAYAYETAVKTDFEVFLIECYRTDTQFYPAALCHLRGYESIMINDVELEYDIETDTWIPKEQLIREAKEKYKREIEAQKTPREKEIEKIENKYTKTPADKELLRLLELSKTDRPCANDTLVSQTYREFEVAWDLITDPETGEQKIQLAKRFNIKDFNMRNNYHLKALSMAIEECIGQPNTKKSVQYDHIDVEDKQISHPDAAFGIPHWTVSRATIEANEGVEQPDTHRDLVCTNYNHRTALVMGYDCPIVQHPERETPSIKPDMREYGESQSFKDWVKYQQNPDSQLAGIKAKMVNKAIEQTNIGGRQ